jgi:uncharacterized glyoxalase superfamily protein PhnB
MTTMKPTPAGWPRISPGVYYRDAMAMLEWLPRAFGFTVQQQVVEDGHLVHSQLIYGDGLIMVGEELAGDQRRFGIDRLSPASTGCNTQNLMVYVDEVDAHCAVARAAGATIVAEPEDHDYGEGYWCDRAYGATDPEGHLWWFVQRLRG